MKKVDLSKFANPQYKPGSFLKRSLWFIANTLFIQSAHPFSSVRIITLKCFGAKVGIGCVVRPRVNIKHPWLLSIGNHTWIGENVWIDNLTDVSIGNHVCMSQGATIITGNHRWDKVTFDLTLHPITIQDGAWIGAKATLLPGAKIEEHAVVTAGSIVHHTIPSYEIWQGNPALFIKKRNIH
jgi:putative colanic acid biosynthesis acetyltransferase WcaF